MIDKEKLPPLRYYKSLDGVRGIAALMIMFFHFMPAYDKAAHPVLFMIRKLAVAGQTGVVLFFVLSGFLITRILLQQKLKQGYFKQFYLKRALRIFPLYYLFLLICFFILPLLNNAVLPPFSQTWYYYFYLQNIAMTFDWKLATMPHLWSLAVEEHFYLFWPVVVYFCPDKVLKYIIAGWVVFALLCRVYLIANGTGTFYFTLTNFDSLALGAFLALNEKYHYYSAGAMIKLAVITLIPLCIIWPFVSGLGNDYVQYFKTPVISLLYMALIGFLVQRQTLIGSFFSTKALRYTGKISYGLYVFHPLCFGFVGLFVSTNNFWASFITCFLLAYLVASLSYYGFEMWFLKLKTRYQAPHTIDGPKPAADLHKQKK